jgi:hypothetical protein
MRNLLGTISLSLFAICLESGAPRPAAADTALGTSTWSLELATDLGAGANDASFAVRRHSGASSALRLKIEVSDYEFDGDGTRSTTGSPDGAADQSSQSSTYAFSVQWMRFATIRDNVTATFALGPTARWTNGHYAQTFDGGLPTFSGYEYSEKTTSFGLDLGLGIEWFLNRRISLGGQSGLRATAGTSKVVNISRSGTGATYQKTETNVDGDITQVTTATTRIQLTAYF